MNGLPILVLQILKIVIFVITIKTMKIQLEQAKLQFYNCKLEKLQL